MVTDTERRMVRTKYGDSCAFCGWFQWYCPDLTTGHAITKPVAVLEFEDGSCAMVDVGDFRFTDSRENFGDRYGD